jgi:hypothetical protein
MSFIQGFHTWQIPFRSLVFSVPPSAGKSPTWAGSEGLSPMGAHRVISSVHANLKETGPGQSGIRMVSHEISKLRLSMGDWFFFDASSAPHGANVGNTQAVVPRRQWLDRRRQGPIRPNPPSAAILTVIMNHLLISGEKSWL